MSYKTRARKRIIRRRQKLNRAADARIDALVQTAAPVQPRKCVPSVPSAPGSERRLG